MGDPKRHRKKYVTPRKPWDKVRLEREAQLLIKYGLRNKRELWRFENILRKYRRVARDLLSKVNLPGREGEIARAKANAVIKKLVRIGVLEENATLDDILNLTVEDFLERRLQTVVYRQGLARTIKQARQLITHGHIAIDGRRVTSPSYIVERDEETKIGFYPNSPFAKG
ncbi:30S ribosomal protein S4 [Archaeoglobus profundus]|uniref:Small ribosomal subunit protein uS4 n=1 Tax=Archaeoglobus profundus (strain DSM 5631 / JCM 9629 / NBRC 100127 / Av18) TaxID=572546 RepID=D2RD92_ARCPA|nr:30S ribosomal protein S4 [Archaeoglobus profundus]ADB58086.1 ribosomal protein S4 [Archaeoglobus profundus DSM 5631]